MTFILQHNKEGRVLIDTRLRTDHVKIRDIDAATRHGARDSIDELEFSHVEGYGWFV